MSTVLITRPTGVADPLVSALEGLGYRVYAVPTAATRPSEFDQPELSNYDWVVVTSAAAVDALRQVETGHLWAAVGEATSRALRARGVEPAFVPEESNGLALADALPDVRGKRVLLIRAKAAAADLPMRLRERGAMVEELAAYETVEGPPTSAAPLTVALRDSDLSAIVFASGSAVRGFIALGGTPVWPAVTIGPRTTEVARRHGFRVIGEAREQSTESLAAAVVDAIPVEESSSA